MKAGESSSRNKDLKDLEEKRTEETVETTGSKEAQGKVGAVLVVGGGIAGMQASLDLAEAGFKVHLVDASPSIGGAMAQLDKTFPTNDCAMCIMSPKLVQSGRHRNIDIITNAEVEEIRGEVGNFDATIRKKARYIDVDKCTGCGVCAQECPIDAINPFNKGLSQQRAVFIRYPQAVPLAYSIDRETCIGCGLCENLCLADAVKYDDKDEGDVLRVGAVILAPGFELFDPGTEFQYGYGQYPNVMTSLEFERILSASGPYRGMVLRPWDGKIPGSIAFIQCIGSRGMEGQWCSSACCMYATKESIIAMEHAPGLKCAVFYMDLRAHGKGFDAYYERAKEAGVRYIRCRPASIKEVPETKNLRIQYQPDGGALVTEEFDMVVLSCGLWPPRHVDRLAERLGIKLNEYGFCSTSRFAPLESNREGIFVCGPFTEPKDIPETVTQASGAAAKAMELLAEARGTMIALKEYPPETDVSGQEPRIGVFVCNCGINIGGVVDVPRVAEYARSLPNVVYTDHNLFTCSTDTQEKVTKAIKEHDLNRVVVASCTPRTHEPLFQETIREGGLNPYLFEMANIRDQCSWVHMHAPDEATAKAKDLVKMAVAKARLIRPLEPLPLDVIQKALVIGGGLAGMTAALAIARQGYEVYLVEKEGELGGNLRNLHYTFENDDVQSDLESLVKEAEENPKITVYKGAKIEQVDGFVGNYKTTLKTEVAAAKASGRSRAMPKEATPARTVEVEHGVVVVATGAEEYEPEEYLYGKDPRVITQRKLEELLSQFPLSPKQPSRKGKKETPSPTPQIAALDSVVMIQCVGSRNDERPYCSRICCSEAVKNALKLKELSPQTEIFVLYRDMRTYGFSEARYTEAREQGVRFIRYEEDNKPDVSAHKGKLRVAAFDSILGANLQIDCDLVVLSPAVVPTDGAGDLAQLLKVPLNQDKFFLEAHMKLRPVDFATEGIFLAGMAHSPKSIDETIAQADAVAARAMGIISQDTYMAEPIVASVDEDTCSGCGTCVELCVYSAMKKDEKGIARNTAAMCKGCGTCAASCPEKAISMNHFTDEQLIAQATAALQEIA